MTTENLNMLKLEYEVAAIHHKDLVKKQEALKTEAVSSYDVGALNELCMTSVKVNNAYLTMCEKRKNYFIAEAELMCANETESEDVTVARANYHKWLKQLHDAQAAILAAWYKREELEREYLSATDECEAAKEKFDVAIAEYESKDKELCDVSYRYKSAAQKYADAWRMYSGK